METLLLEVLNAEQNLCRAMLNNDVDALDNLLADGLLFAGPDGNLATKEDDLAAHRNKRLRLSKLDIGEPQLMKLTDAVVLSSVQAALAGDYSGTAFEGSYRYTRVWVKKNGNWEIAGGQCGAIGK